MSPPWNHPRADKMTTLHLRTSANYCLCPEFIPPWRCRHFVGGSVLRFKGPLAKGAVMRSMTGGLAGDQRSPLRAWFECHEDMAAGCGHPALRGAKTHTHPKIPIPPPQQAALRSKPPDPPRLTRRLYSKAILENPSGFQRAAALWCGFAYFRRNAKVSRL